LFLEYDFTFVYKPGRTYVVVHALSRLQDITKPTSVHDQITYAVMDRTRAKQSKEAWLQPSEEIQDKTRQDKIGQYWRTRSSIDPSTGVGLLEGCPPNYLLL
jgi:hypothetical protein